MKKFFLGFCFLILGFLSFAQFKADKIKWTSDGNSMYEKDENSITKMNLKTGQQTVLVPADVLKVNGKKISIADFEVSNNDQLVLIFTNTARVWRYNTRGDYWYYHIPTKRLQQIGKDRPAQSVLYAKISPDGELAAYVSENNIYVEELASGKSKAITSTNNTKKLINGTFDWVYEEEFGCRDGFRWSADSKSIAYWQVDANQIKDYYMLNTTDDNYSKVIPVEYPKVGEQPSPVKIGVVNIKTGETKWMDIPGDPANNYLPRMEWSGADELIVQQLNRKQNESKLYFCNTTTGEAKQFYSETDKAWIDIKSRWNDDDPRGWEFMEKGKSFLWVSEKDGWRHIYKVTRDGKETLLTIGNYDIGTISAVDEAKNELYFIASPDNPIQRYLYKVKMDGKSKAVRVTPAGYDGTNSYECSPTGSFAVHSFTSRSVAPATQFLNLATHKPVAGEELLKTMKPVKKDNLEYFTITTEDGITMDGWMSKPKNYDPSKKYPVLLYVYSEPAATTVEDDFYAGNNFMFGGDMNAQGYFYVSFNSRGTPTLKGAEWRKSIYKQIGRINIRDQAMGMKKLLADRPYLDASRVAVWGWSGGGSTTLHLMFQYPDLFQTGIAVAAVGNQLFYDNIYQERYMGLPQENKDDFIKGSPITYAKNLKGNLLYVHGTGDDNVHYSNAEVLVNELIKHGKLFQFMPYPNRTHSISEGAGTFQHLSKLYTAYLKEKCPPGAR
ncbi:S9 family peptidase [Lacibacter sp.]|uniref:S9 family peptidase n=1 Tax=Lacibacter sp. TaxID=1915409 RepID=UPI002B4ABB09|nr:S9 family peptidase [Lacibacter sp.]HLP36362.1 S9 family peptidase [Lacibacter sp.]